MILEVGVDPRKTQRETEDTKGCHVRLSFLSKNYINHVNMVVDVVGDEAQVIFHRVRALEAYFTNLRGFHKYNSGTSNFVYLYSKLA